MILTHVSSTPNSSLDPNQVSSTHERISRNDNPNLDPKPPDGNQTRTAMEIMDEDVRP